MRLVWSALLAAVAAALIVVGVPTWHVRPFAPQTSRLLAVSYQLKQAAPVATIVALGAVLACAALLVRRTRWWQRAALVVLVGATAGAAWFSRQNHFEWMFQPLPAPRYVGIDAARCFLMGGEIVMGVTDGAVSVAFPIRQMAYHHLVNDRVGTMPVVVTY